MEEFSMHLIRFSKVRKSSTTRIEMKSPTSYTNNHKQLRIHPKYENVKCMQILQIKYRTKPPAKHAK